MAAAGSRWVASRPGQHDLRHQLAARHMFRSASCHRHTAPLSAASEVGVRRQLTTPAVHAGTCRSVRRHPCVARAGPPLDYYQILGVESSADAKAIKKAFRTKALKLHPDVNKAPDAAEQFARAKEAYNVLSDTEERRKYDMLRGSGYSYDPYSSGGGFSDFGFGGTRTQQKDEEFYGFGDFFRDLGEELDKRSKKRTDEGKRPKTLMQELADLGEEFVEFLEQELQDEEEEMRKEQQRKRRLYEEVEREAAQAKAAAEKKKRDDDDIDDLLQKMKKNMGL